MLGSALAVLKIQTYKPQPKLLSFGTVQSNRPESPNTREMPVWMKVFKKFWILLLKFLLFLNPAKILLEPIQFTSLLEE